MISIVIIHSFTCCSNDFFFFAEHKNVPTVYVHIYRQLCWIEKKHFFVHTLPSVTEFANK